jgi:hypothetical protein
MEALTFLSSSYAKQVRACELTAPKLSRLGIAGDVVKLLAAFIIEKYPDAAAKLLEVLEPFGAELVKVYG